MQEYYPSVESNRQICAIWSDETLRDTLQQILRVTQLRNCPNAEKRFYKVLQRCAKEGLPDHEIYSKLHSLVQDELMKMEEYRAKHTYQGTNLTEERAMTRVKRIIKLIEQHKKISINSFLDVGCSEASITSAMAKALQLPPEKAHGCDIKECNTSDLITFRKLQSDALPYSNDEFSLITALMSVHHMKSPQKILREIYRVLQPGGLFITREHDCNNPELAIVLDVVHGLYSMVWSKEKEMDDFTKHFARYTTQQDFNSMVTSCGFIEEYCDRVAPINQKHDASLNPSRCYFAVYRKPLASDRSHSKKRKTSIIADDALLQDEEKKRKRLERFGRSSV